MIRTQEPLVETKNEKSDSRSSRCFVNGGKPPLIGQMFQGNHSINSIAKKCKTVLQIKQLQAHIFKTLQPFNPFAIAPLLSTVATSCEGSFFSYARFLFKNLYHRNTFVYNTMIRGYMQMNFPTDAVLCYLDMLNHGLAANNYTFPSLIKACKLLFSTGSSMENNFGSLVHCHVVKFGFSDDPFVLSSLIEFYSSVRDMKIARKLFDVCSERDVVIWTAMIDGYGKLGDIENAQELFDKMPDRNTISWSALMAAYSRVSDFKEVLHLFRLMQETGIKPNESVLVSVLTACAHLGTVAQGLWVHSYAKRFKSNPILDTALVDMYSKCGYLESALSVFNAISEKDAGAWNAMISCFAMNGNPRKSLELFNQMVKTGTRPTETTFVALLTGFTHGMMINEGLELFEQMDSYGVEPKLEHYACVVDLLARSGLVEEAEKFIEEKIGGLQYGDANVWGAVLGACRIHGNVEFGNRVLKKLADIGIAADCGARVLSYNIYKEAGWDTEAKRVRKSISEGGNKKIPGCSVIEITGVVEEFLAGDVWHPQMPEMYKILDSLSKMLNLDEFKL